MRRYLANDGRPINTTQLRTTNQVLASIPAQEYKLEPIDLNFGEVLYEPATESRRLTLATRLLHTQGHAVDMSILHSAK